jgi:NAD(P)-dependent dehydrogenase (short-subunit alcohol dehydrogenase family)
MSDRFEGKVAIVTGGATGIGRGIAQAFAREGAKVVVVTDSNVTGAEETVASIKHADGEATFVKCDVTNETDVAAMVAACVKAYGRLDYACNNAGVGPDGKRFPVIDIADSPREIWDKTVGINLTGVFLCLKHEIRQMTAQGHGGAIVNTSSVGSLKPLAGFAAYASSKAGLNTLTRVAAQEAAPARIKVNAIMPCPTERTMLLDNLAGADPNMREFMANGIPLGRLATPEDMAAAVMWLCSDESFLTGHALPVDGGMLSA